MARNASRGEPSSRPDAKNMSDEPFWLSGPVKRDLNMWIGTSDCLTSWLFTLDHSFSVIAMVSSAP